MRRGDVFWVNLDPVVGSEAAKKRPAVIVSNDGSNAGVGRLGRGTVTVVPLTSNTARVYPFQVLIPAEDHPGLRDDSKAQAEQVRTVDAKRLGDRITRLPAATMKDIDAALRLHLAL
jgi:mRNA interferase MazF